MVLVSFSEQRHVYPIYQGQKAQTTRIINKRRYRVGQTLHIYFKSRMKKSCKNCIRPNCDKSNYKQVLGAGGLCDKEIGFPYHKNLFGLAKVKEVSEYPEGFIHLSQEQKEKWAVLDGFENWEEANKWFIKKHGEGWELKPMVVIRFCGDWL